MIARSAVELAITRSPMVWRKAVSSAFNLVMRRLRRTDDTMVATRRMATRMSAARVIRRLMACASPVASVVHGGLEGLEGGAGAAQGPGQLDGDVVVDPPDAPLGE